MKKIKNDNVDCTEMLRIVEDEQPEYSDYLTHFKVSNSLEECGEFYKDLSECYDLEMKKLVYIILYEYVDVVAPYAYIEVREMASNIMPDVFDENSLLKSRTRFKKYITGYKGLLKEFK